MCLDDIFYISEEVYYSNTQNFHRKELLLKLIIFIFLGGMIMKDKYDVIIVGAGPAGIFAAYEFTLKAPQLKILLIDKGNDIYHRVCPILNGNLKICPHTNEKTDYASCSPACSITSGFGGAGAYSDGKFNITTEFGGWLSEYISDDMLLDLIRYVDQINLRHGATTAITNPNTESVRLIEQKVYGAGLKLLKANVRHLGTENNIQILKNIFEYLKDKITMLFKTKVEKIITGEKNNVKKIEGIQLENSKIYYADNIIIAPGRDGAKWLGEIFRENNLKLHNNQVDIGVRVETSDIIMREINENLYEGKFLFNSSVGTQVRTFCSNPSGHVVIENHSGVMAANGHSFSDKALGSQNTNFALLVSHKFSEPFNKPNEYAIEICKRANDLSNGSVIVQKFGDIVKGRRSTEKRIKEGFISPTLKEAIPGDLGLVLPYNTMKSLIEMIHALDKVTPGIASEHTLFYGVEAKFYSARPITLETEIKGLYCGGDGAGITRGLAQAGAAGILISRSIINSLNH